jgi:hypothetical protein
LRSPTASGNPQSAALICYVIAVAGTTAPMLAIGDNALGFWKAIWEVFPDTGEQ